MFKKDCYYTDDEINTMAQELLNNMKLKEKINMLNGRWDPIRNGRKYKNQYNPIPIKTNGCKRLNVSPIKFTDGPRGVVMGHSTCFPVSMARGASFDIELENRVGNVIGIESRAQGANLFAGICINLLRHPSWGRAQETYSEDPFHLGMFGKTLTKAVQAHNVIACIKHFALNNIENSRFRVNIKSDKRTLHEVYLPHFKKCIEAGAGSVMGAYNLYDGDHCCESKYLLNDILRDNWKFTGFVMSDFLYGIRNAQKAIESGLDLEMPMPIEYGKNLQNLVEEGIVDISYIDTAVLRILKTIITFEETDDSMEYNKSLVACDSHTALALEVAEKSMVLLKNEDDILPFSYQSKKILLVGKLAKASNTGDHGSSRIFAPYTVSPLKGVKNYFGKNAEVLYSDGSDVSDTRRMAANADCVIICVGCNYNDEGEFLVPDSNSNIDMFECVSTGYYNQGNKVKSLLTKIGAKFIKNDKLSGMGGDRDSLSLNQRDIHMIENIGDVNPNTVVNVIGGSMIMTKEWENVVPSIIYGWYAGMQGGNALANIIFGDVNPSGKLPFTIPNDSNDLAYFSNKDNEITYDMYHGYTLLDKVNIKPAYPYGWGLSYTTFTFSNIAVRKKGFVIEVKLTIKNTGEFDGEEVAQVYVGMEDSNIERQIKLLKGFKKVFIKKQTQEKVTILIPISELNYYNVKQEEWVFEKGNYQFMVGSSSSKNDLTIVNIDL